MPTHPIRLIVGLSNPGKQYQDTRHNAGAWFVEQLAKSYTETLKPSAKFSGATCTVQINQAACHLLIPSTFMNHNGRSIAAIAKFYKIPSDAILIAHDELDFPAGTIRLKQGGGHGGHNGLRDTISALGSAAFLRFRIGIGHPGNADQVSDYVLSKPSKHDYQRISSAISDGLTVIDSLIAGKTDHAIHQLHSD